MLGFFLGLSFLGLLGMTIALKVARAVTIDGATANETRNLTADQVACKINKLIPAAKAGTLSVRTSDSVGTITLGVSASVTTGALVTLFWDGGRRYNVLVGTVAGTSCPITSGAGDVLPTAATVLTIGVQQDFEVAINGTKLRGYTFESGQRGICILTDDSDVYAHHEDTAAANQMQDWVYGGADANPITGDIIATVTLAHADTTGTAAMEFTAAVNQ